MLVLVQVSQLRCTYPLVSWETHLPSGSILKVAPVGTVSPQEGRHNMTYHSALVTLYWLEEMRLLWEGKFLGSGVREKRKKSIYLGKDPCREGAIEVASKILIIRCRQHVLAGFSFSCHITRIGAICSALENISRPLLVLVKTNVCFGIHVRII